MSFYFLSNTKITPINPVDLKQFLEETIGEYYPHQSFIEVDENFMAKNLKNDDVLIYDGIENNRKILQISENFSRKLLINDDMKDDDEHLPRQFSLVQLIVKIDHLLDIPKNDLYFRVPLDVILKLGVITANIYLRMLDGQMVKYRNAYDHLSIDDKKKILCLPEHQVYLKKDESQLMIQEIETMILHRIQNDMASDNLESAVQNAKDLAAIFSIDEQSLEIVDGLCSDIIDSINSESNLKNYFYQIKSENIRDYEIIMLTNYLCHFIAKDIVNLNSKKIFVKLIKASIFKDIALGREVLGFILNNDGEDFLNLSHRERKSIINHPLESSVILQKYQLFDNDIHSLIRKHHERPDGMGFPKSETVDVFSPLLNVFLISYRLAYYTLNYPANSEKELLENSLRLLAEEGFNQEPFSMYLTKISASFDS
ncbi:hypothetical protein OAB57_01805 [Bacteriovoracaceae bacterium]|nr:hypothetical protein [Bacteriovoracaceae bacterium]